MGLLSRIRDALDLPGHLATLGAGSAPMASPWRESSHLHPIVAPDVLGATAAAATVSRADAIRIPAVARARGLIVSTIARVPLAATDADGHPATAPDWLTAAAGHTTPFHRMLWTADDIFFHGWSLWAVDRDAEGAITAAERVPHERWTLTAEGVVMVDDYPAAAGDVILFPGVTEGLLTHGADTLHEAHRLARSAARAADNPAAQVELHQTTDAPMSKPEINELIQGWAKARRGENGGVAYTSSAIEVKEHGASSEHLLIEGRNQAAVDVARHAGIPATMIDATLSGSSLSYQNTAARLSELITFGVAPLMSAIAARLSLDDVTPPGITVEFDTATTLQNLAGLYQSGSRAEDDAGPAVDALAPDTTEEETR